MKISDNLAPEEQGLYTIAGVYNVVELDQGEKDNNSKKAGQDELLLVRFSLKSVNSHYYKKTPANFYPVSWVYNPGEKIEDLYNVVSESSYSRVAGFEDWYLVGKQYYTKYK